MAKRSEHSLEELKALVLEAAETIVRQEGFSGLKVRTIASEIGYTVGSIYMVFTNMAELIMHINARTLDAIAGELKHVQDTNAEQSIQALAVTYLNFASQNFNRWRTIFEYPLPEDAEFPGWYQEKMDNVFAPVEARFLELAPEHSQEQRTLAARALWYGVHGICVLSVTGKQDEAEIRGVEKMIVLLVRNFMRSWAACSK